MEKTIAYSKAVWVTFPSYVGPLLQFSDEDTESEDRSVLEAWPWSTNPQNRHLNRDEANHAVYPIKSNSVNLVSIRLCSRQITHISPDISFYGGLIKRLYLCCNNLKSLPDEIGYLHNLQELFLERNNLKELPESIGHLKNLSELHLDFNRLKELPESLVHLTKLKTLNVSYNALTNVPPFIGKLNSLVNLDISANPIKFLPFEITLLPKLRRFHAHECRFHNELPDQPESRDNVPSLKELAARQLYRSYIGVGGSSSIPLLIKEYIDTSKICSFCAGPFFEHVVYRYSWWKKNGRRYPIYHRLCWNHWGNCQERITALFEKEPSQTPLPAKFAGVFTDDETDTDSVFELRKVAVKLSKLKPLPEVKQELNVVQRETYRWKKRIYTLLQIKW